MGVPLLLCLMVWGKEKEWIDHGQRQRNEKLRGIGCQILGGVY